MKTPVSVALWLMATVALTACETADKAPVAEAPPRTVKTQTVTPRDLPVVVSAVGRLTPDREVVISAEVGGILTHYAVDVGAVVTRGGEIATIDSTDYSLALKEAEANLLAARIRLPVAMKNFERARRLLPEKVITPERYDQAEAEYKAAEALVVQLETIVDQARRRLEKTAIVAPFDGYVSRRFVETGQHVAIGDPIMQVADMQSMRVKIHINERDYVHVDKHDPVSVMVEAFPGQTVSGRVDTIGVQADARTNTFQVEILVDNPDVRLKAGLTARVDIRTDLIPGAIMIGQQSVLFREDRQEVFVIDDHRRAEARRVRLGRLDGSDVRILEGLAPGDRLVVAGGQYLKPGDPVVVMP